MSKFLVLLSVFVAGCASHLPMPMTAGDVAGRSDGEALVTYLGQRDASAAVCDLHAGGPHLITADGDARDELVSGLRERSLDPTLWRDCVDRLARSIDRESAAALLDDVIRSYVVAVADVRVEYYPVTQQQLSAMHAVLLEEPGGAAPHAETMADFVSLLRDNITTHRLGPVATRFATEMIDVEDLGHGVREGQRVDSAALTSLFEKGDEAMLRHAARRVPDVSLRAFAQRLVIRHHIQASPLAEVRQNAAAVEAAMMRTGVNPVAMSEHRPLRAWVDAGIYADRGVRVRQDLRRHTNTLLGSAADGSISVLPQPSLRGALSVDVDGIDHPITLCASSDALDPSPCLPASAVTLGSDLVHVEPDGTLRFAERLTGREAAALASSGRQLVVAVSVGGQRLTELTWKLEFETPADLVLASHARGGEGPDLRVTVDPMPTGRFGYTIVDGDETYEAVVESSRANSFHVVSKGADGSNGSDGTVGFAGAPGPPGAPASCPSFAGTNGGRGGDGGAGGDGEAGHAGASGGNILVELRRSRGSSVELLEPLRSGIRSVGGLGGAGGSGGAGGRGGTGGMGGPGTTCFDSEGKVTILSGGQSGLSGTDGRSGFIGSRGANGRDGQVTVRVIE